MFRSAGSGGGAAALGAAGEGLRKRCKKKKMFVCLFKRRILVTLVMYTCRGAQWHVAYEIVWNVVGTTKVSAFEADELFCFVFYFCSLDVSLETMLPPRRHKQRFALGAMNPRYATERGAWATAPFAPLNAAPVLTLNPKTNPEKAKLDLKSRPSPKSKPKP